MTQGTKAHRHEGTKAEPGVVLLCNDSLRASVPPCLRASSRHAFSFPEVLFAVIVLGIGFIMIAAVFPVALSQSKATKEETTAAAYAQQAVEVIKQVGAVRMPPMFPVTGGEMLAVDPMLFTQYNSPSPPNPPDISPGPHTYNAVRGGLISVTDPRFAYAIFYKRGGTAAAPDSFAQVTVIVAQSQGEGRNTFDGNIMSGAAINNACDIYQQQDFFHNLRPRPVRVEIVRGDPTAKVRFSAIANPDPTFTNSSFLPQAVAPGGYIIIRNDRIDNSGALAQNIGRMNGRIFRIGQPVPGTTDQYELDPAWDFRGDPGYDEAFSTPSPGGNDILAIGTSDSNSSVTVSSPALAYVLGRPIVSPDTTIPRNLARVATGEAKFEGPAMDVAVYTTFIKVE